MPTPPLPRASRLVLLLLLVLPAPGCPAPAGKDSTAPIDTTSTDTGNADSGGVETGDPETGAPETGGTDTGPTFDGTFTFAETLFGVPVGGADVWLDGRDGAWTTDAEGRVTVPIPSEVPFALVATAPDQPDLWFHGFASWGAFAVISAWPSLVALDELAALAGVSQDPAAGTLMIAFLTNGDEYYPTESDGPFTLSVDAGYDGAVEMLDGAPTGYVPGDTPGWTGFAVTILFNVPTGTRVVTPTGNDGGCAVWEFQSGEFAPEFEVRADTLTVVDFMVDCD